MLQEALSWTQETQEHWRMTREKGCLNYIFRIASIAFLGASAVSVVHAGIALARGGEIALSTVLMMPALGLLSGLIIGRSYWSISETSFKEWDSR